MKLMRKQVLLLVTLFLMAGFGIFTSNAMAEGYTWDEYKIGFDIPSSLKVDVNDAEKFMATNEKNLFIFAIVPWKDASVKAEDILPQAIAGFGITPSDDLQVFAQPDFNGFKGYEGTGTGTFSGESIAFRVFGFIDPETSVNLVAYAIYAAGVNDAGNEKTALAIFESIEKIK